MIRAEVTGRLGIEPRRHTARNGRPMATASIAANVARNHDDTDTAWINIVAFGPLADELLGIHKGERVTAAGHLVRERYKGRDGASNECWSLKVNAILKG